MLRRRRGWLAARRDGTVGRRQDHADQRALAPRAGDFGQRALRRRRWRGLVRAMYIVWATNTLVLCLQYPTSCALSCALSPMRSHSSPCILARCNCLCRAKIECPALLSSTYITESVSPYVTLPHSTLSHIHRQRKMPFLPRQCMRCTLVSINNYCSTPSYRMCCWHAPPASYSALPQKQRNKALTLAHAQTTHYTSN